MSLERTPRKACRSSSHLGHRDRAARANIECILSSQDNSVRVRFDSPQVSYLYNIRPNPESPDDWDTTSLLGGCASSNIIVSDTGIGKGMGTNKGAGQPRDTRLAFCCKDGAVSYVLACLGAELK